MSNPPTVPSVTPVLVTADLGQTIKYILENIGSGGVATSIDIDSNGTGNWDGFTSPAIIKIDDNNGANLILVNNTAGDAKFTYVQVREDGSLNIVVNDFVGSELSLNSDGTWLIKSDGANNGIINFVNPGILTVSTLNYSLALTEGDSISLINITGHNVITLKDNGDVSISTKSGTSTIVIDGTTGYVSITSDRISLSSDRIAMGSLPTSSVGLGSGDLWNDSGTVKIV